MKHKLAITIFILMLLVAGFVVSQKYGTSLRGIVMFPMQPRPVTGQPGNPVTPVRPTPGNPTTTAPTTPVFSPKMAYCCMETKTSRSFYRSSSCSYPLITTKSQLVRSATELSAFVSACR